MERENFNEIIDFAIEREQEAVKFYHDLQGMVLFKARQEMLRELEDMEKGHVKTLEGIRKGSTKITESPKVQNMKISDYLVEAKPAADMSYQDIIITAMKREEASVQLYTDLANLSADAAVKQLFLNLTAEEAKHKLKFEKIYNDEILKDN
jgi:rubrerythrin